MGYIAGIFIVGIIVYGLYSLCELFVKRKERMAIIERMALGEIRGVPDFKESPINIKVNSFTALNIGCLFIGLGLGLVLATLVDISLFTSTINSPDFYDRREVFNLLYPSMSLLFGGVGLVIAFVIERKSVVKAK